MSIPDADLDLFSDQTLADTPSHYKTLRDLGPIVHLPANHLFAVTRYDAVRAALRADATLVSSRGVAANEFINNTPTETTLTSDGEVHRHRRSMLMRPLVPGSLRDINERINTAADQLVQTLVDRGEFCGVREFAQVLPVSIVSELVGLEESGRENMLEWAAATFDAMGPMNRRTEQALETVLGLIQYVQTLSPERVKPGGWAAGVLGEIATGELTPSEAAMMVIDYVAPSLDTTILATAHMLWRLGATPGALERLRCDPNLIPGMINESVRLASPIRAFTRFAITDYRADSVTIPAGSRVAILYASANRDERHYPDPDQFHVDRNPRDHVGWGHGAHSCAGKHLARMEMEALTRALLKHVKAIEVGAPVPIVNNVLQGFESLPVAFSAVG